jgi:hypothetical protein
MIDPHQETAVKLRETIVNLFLGHLACAVLGLIFVTFVVTISSIVFFAILYSLYLTLRNYMTWVYVLFLSVNAVYGILTIWMYNGLGLFMYALIIAFYCGAAVKLKRDNSKYR